MSFVGFSQRDREISLLLLAVQVYPMAHQLITRVSISLANWRRSLYDILGLI